MHTSLPPTKQCRSHGVTKCVADPEHLFRVRCTKCDYVRDYSQNGAGAAKYLYHRRRTRAAEGLLSVGAPLEAGSAAFLCRTASECGIISNTAQPHVSFVEGLVPDIDHTAAVGYLRNALFCDSTLTVVSVHRVPRRDNVTDLILADVVLNPGADYAATQLSDGRVCNLPQFPFHVALGACPRARGGSKRAAAWAEARLRGVMLAVDPTRVRVLPPPEGGKRQHKQVQQQPQSSNVQQKQAPQRHWQRHVTVGSGGIQLMTHEPYANYSESETGETDVSSTSASLSSSSEEQEVQFPGLAVDLTFLDESDHVPCIVGADAKSRQQCAASVPVYQNAYVQPMPTTIWAQS